MCAVRRRISATALRAAGVRVWGLWPSGLRRRAAAAAQATGAAAPGGRCPAAVAANALGHSSVGRLSRGTKVARIAATRRGAETSGRVRAGDRIHFKKNIKYTATVTSGLQPGSPVHACRRPRTLYTVLLTPTPDRNRRERERRLSPVRRAGAPRPVSLGSPSRSLSAPTRPEPRPGARGAAGSLWKSYHGGVFCQPRRGRAIRPKYQSLHLWKGPRPIAL